MHRGSSLAGPEVLVRVKRRRWVLETKLDESPQSPDETFVREELLAMTFRLGSRLMRLSLMPSDKYSC